VQSSVTKYESWEEVFTDFNYSEDRISKYIFFKKDDIRDKYILEYPELFKWLIKAFLFSGKINRYPLHLVVVGPPGTGKSWLTESLAQKFDDGPMIFSGSSSIKAFIPSAPNGRYNKGYLYSAKNMLTVDEMFNLFLKSQKDEDGTLDIQKFNSILENMAGKSGTAFGTHEEEMKAKSLWVTNPTDKSNLNFEKSINSFPASSMQRFLFFSMGGSFIDFLRNVKLQRVEEDIDVNKNKWIMLMNFFLSPEAAVEYDNDRVHKIINNARNLCPEDLLHLYETRLMNHHAILVFEGLVRWRIIFQKDKTLTAKEQDYIDFEQLWEYVIRSWKGDNKNLYSMNERRILELIPPEGIHRVTLIRRVEKLLNIDDDKTRIISNMIKDLRNYGEIHNGKKDDLDKQTIYRSSEQELSLKDLSDNKQTGQLTLS
jgi:adenylate kinase family enzyme